MAATTITLYPRAPFDFEQSLRFLRSFGPMQADHTIADGTLTRAIYVHPQTVVFSLRAQGSAGEAALRCTIFTATAPSAALAEAVADRVSFSLSLDDDLRPFYRLAAEDPDFAPVLKQLHGYHQVKFFTPFEAACWAVLIQRNMLKIASRMKQDLVEHTGNQASLDGVVYRAFPDAAQVAALDDVSTIIGHSQKGIFLAAVAEAFSAVDEQFLRTAPYAEVQTWLRSIRGVGAWSAAFILLRGLGRMERLPLDEKWLGPAAARVYRAGAPLAPGEIEDLAADYGEWQGYWAHYLRVY